MVRTRRVHISLGAGGCNEEEFSPSWLSHHKDTLMLQLGPSALQLNTDRRQSMNEVGNKGTEEALKAFLILG